MLVFSPTRCVLRTTPTILWLEICPQSNPTGEVQRVSVDAPDRGSANTRETEDDDNLAVTPTTIEIYEPPPHSPSSRPPTPTVSSFYSLPSSPPSRPGMGDFEPLYLCPAILPASIVDLFPPAPFPSLPNASPLTDTTRRLMFLPVSPRPWLFENYCQLLYLTRWMV